ncbi:ABC transporter ATP-binding protein [Listeria kieliensis]
MTIQRGDFIVIYGKSGTGKSTLLHILGGIEPADNGDVCIDGKSVSKMPLKEKRLLRRNKLGFIFQNYALIDNETVFANLCLVEKDPKRISAVLQQVQLGDTVLARKVFELSGGEQQRVAMARVLLQQVEIILADEPTGNLDAENAELSFALLKRFQEQGKTIICVTHDEKAFRYANRLFLLENGRVEEQENEIYSISNC